LSNYEHHLFAIEIDVHSLCIAYYINFTEMLVQKIRLP